MNSEQKAAILKEISEINGWLKHVHNCKECYPRNGSEKDREAKKRIYNYRIQISKLLEDI